MSIAGILMNWGKIVVAYSWTLINNIISIFRLHPPMKLTKEATEAEKITQEDSAAELLANNSNNTPLNDAKILDSLPNIAVNLNEAKNNADGDNIANSSDEDSITEESCPEPSEECPDIEIRRSEYKTNGLKLEKIESTMKSCPEYRGQINMNDIVSVLNVEEPTIYIVHDEKRPMSHATLLYIFVNGKKPLYFDSNGGCPTYLRDIVDWNRFKVQADSNNTCAIHCIFVAINISRGKPWPEILMEYKCGSCDDNDEKVIHFFENLT